MRSRYRFGPCQLETKRAEHRPRVQRSLRGVAISEGANDRDVAALVDAREERDRSVIRAVHARHQTRDGAVRVWRDKAKLLELKCL